MDTNLAPRLLSDHLREFLDGRLASEIDPISATAGAVARQIISDHKRLSNWLYVLVFVFTALSTVLAIVAMIAGTWLPVSLLIIGIAVAVWRITTLARRRADLINQYDQQAVFLETIPHRHRKPILDYLDIFSSGQMNIVDQTGTRIVLKGETSCYWLLASVEQIFAKYPRLRPAAEFQHPLRVEEPTRGSAPGQRETRNSGLEESRTRSSMKARSERYQPFVESISEIELNKLLHELQQLLGAAKWDDQQENAIKVAKQLSLTGATWRNQTEFLKDVQTECARKHPQAAPDAEKVRRTLSINQDINDKRSLYRRFLTDESFRSELYAKYGPIQPSLNIEPSRDPT